MKCFEESIKIMKKNGWGMIWATISAFSICYLINYVLNFVFSENNSLWITILGLAGLGYFYNSFSQAHGCEIKNAIIRDWGKLPTYIHFCIIFLALIVKIFPLVYHYFFKYNSIKNIKSIAYG